jgi:hypothetical protein
MQAPIRFLRLTLLFMAVLAIIAVAHRHALALKPSAPPTLVSVIVTPNTIRGKANGIVTLSAPAVANTTVMLEATNEDRISILLGPNGVETSNGSKASVIIPKGASSAGFTVQCSTLITATAVIDATCQDVTVGTTVVVLP